MAAWAWPLVFLVSCCCSWTQRRILVAATTDANDGELLGKRKKRRRKSLFGLGSHCLLACACAFLFCFLAFEVLDSFVLDRHGFLVGRRQDFVFAALGPWGVSLLVPALNACTHIFGGVCFC